MRDRHNRQQPAASVPLCLPLNMPTVRRRSFAILASALCGAAGLTRVQGFCFVPALTGSNTRCHGAAAERQATQQAQQVGSSAVYLHCCWFHRLNRHPNSCSSSSWSRCRHLFNEAHDQSVLVCWTFVRSPQQLTKVKLHAAVQAGRLFYNVSDMCVGTAVHRYIRPTVLKGEENGCFVSLLSSHNNVKHVLSAGCWCT